MKSILDPSFRYTSSANTDIRRTFRRVRREQQKALQRQIDAASAAPSDAPTYPVVEQLRLWRQRG